MTTKAAQVLWNSNQLLAYHLGGFRILFLSVWCISIRNDVVQSFLLVGVTDQCSCSLHTQEPLMLF